MNRRVAIVGLGYVGLPLAVAFGKKCPVIGYDQNRRRIEELRARRDHTGEVETFELSSAQIEFTDDPKALGRADFIIVAVPTPIDKAKQPDLSCLTKASTAIGPNLQRGSIVVYESTVYPGVTEEVCAPILEQTSGMKCGWDFKVGYSPERINPGDKQHTLAKIVKIVSAMDAESLEIVAQVYGLVAEAGVYRAPNIKTAEAAKVIENTQRDLNIALVNELAMIFHKMGLDTGRVLEAAGTKWNFLPFRPGLVGGHCIGVDPYYLTHKADALGYHPQVILAGRRINDGMGKYIAEQTVKLLIAHKVHVRHANVTILGITFKENIQDIRNSKVVDIIRELEEYGVVARVYDPMASSEETQREYDIKLSTEQEIEGADAVILAVPHRLLLTKGVSWIRSLLRHPDRGVVLDVKSALPPEEFKDMTFWRL